MRKKLTKLLFMFFCVGAIMSVFIPTDILAAVRNPTVQIKNFKATKVYSDGFKFDWTATGEKPSTFMVWYTDKSGYGHGIPVEKNKVYKIFDLTKEKGVYELILKARNADKRVLGEAKTKVAINFDEPKISKITNSGLSANIGFTNVAYPRSENIYTLYESSTKGTLGKQIYSGYNPKVVKSKNLKRGVTYYYTLKLSYKGAKSTVSKAGPAKAYTMPKLKAPTNINVYKREKTYIRFNFKKPADGYKYKAYLKGGGYNKFFYLGTISKTKAKISGLQRKSTYYLRLQTYDKYGYKSGYSKIIKFKTK